METNEPTSTPPAAPPAYPPPAPYAVPPADPARANRRALTVLGIVFGGFFVLFLVFLGIAFLAVRGEGLETKGGHGPKVGVVELKGVIGDEENGIEGAKEAEKIREFAENDGIKAILVRIDSPGGAVAPSQEIWRQIKLAREKKKVVCSMGQVAASGGYYIAVACDEIVANAGTLTGSIGVISQFMNAKELVAAAKVEPTVLKTGPYKDSGSPLREFNEQDREYFNQLLDDIYLQFVGAVAEGRKKTVDEIRPLADGRVYTGLQAQKLGLVDTIGSFREAVDRTMKLAGLEGDPQLVYAREEEEFPFLELLRGGARATGREVVRGAVEGVKSELGARGGVFYLAPSYVTGM